MPKPVATSKKPFARGDLILTVDGSGNVAKFRLLSYRHETASALTMLFAVHLLPDVTGFDSEVGDQLEVDFDGASIPGGYILSFKGKVKEWLGEFFHFNGDLILRWTPYGDVEIVTGEGTAASGHMQKSKGSFTIHI